MTSGDTTIDAPRTAFRTCPLCEAGCGLAIEVAGDGPQGEVLRIRGDRDDVFSQGFLCPKGSSLKQLRDDPDRLRTPMVRRDGELVPATWDEAFAAIEAGLLPVIEAHGRGAVGSYLGNPSAHNLGALLYGKAVLRALGSPNVFSASTLDQRPKELSAGLMFGAALTVPVPDIDRTDHLLLLGANPFASNGSLATAPDWPGRLDRIVERGGRLVVVDPRRTRTAEAATEHVAIRPGSDAFFLFSLVHVLFDEGLVDLAHLAPFVDAAAVDEVAAAALAFTPEATAAHTSVDADVTRRLARELAAAPTAAVYGRMGTTTQVFGSLASWLVDVLNVLTGNLDRPGGAMFSRAAAGSPTTRGAQGTGRGVEVARRHTRVRGLPESFGELPVVALAEEIDTPGEGQLRAMVTIAGNPVVSSPDAGRLDAALAGLDFMVSVDIYLNETTRHADVVLPVPDALARSHYDLALLQLGLRNVANYSPPVFQRADGEPDEWEVLARLALVLQGMGADGDPAVVDDAMIASLLRSAVGDATSPVAGRDPEELLAMLAPRTGPERLLDFYLRTGPYGDGFGRTERDWPHAAALPDGVPPLSLDVLVDHPHGVDLGALTPRLPEVLRTASGGIELAPPLLVGDVDRLRAQLAAPTPGPDELVLIGRRHLRSNNSWLHNLPVLVKGKPRCTVQVNPADAARLGLEDGANASVRSRTGVVEIPVEVTDEIMVGVVSIPHGWGHQDLDGMAMAVAGAHAGVNSNVLADTELFDPISGNAVLNGIPVSLAPVGPVGPVTPAVPAAAV